MSAGVLLVGLGQIGMGYDLDLDPRQHVYSHARAFTEHPAFHLLAAVEPDPGRRDLFAQRFARPVYPDIEAALARHRPEVVTVATPTPQHAAAVRSVLEVAAPAAILCEKPLADDIGEARGIVQACAAQGVGLCVNYMRRADPGVIEVRRRLDDGEIGTPVKGVAWYSKGFRHNGSHFFNMAQYWLGPMERFDVLEAGRSLEGADAEPDVRVVFARGTLVFLAAREEHFSHYTVELVAPNGRLRYDQRGALIEWHAAGPDPDFRGYSVLSPDAESLPSGRARYQWHVAAQLAAHLDGRPAHLCSGAEALVTLESMQRIMESR